MDDMTATIDDIIREQEEKQKDEEDLLPHNKTASGREMHDDSLLLSVDDMKTTVEEILREQQERQKSEELLLAREKFEFCKTSPPQYA